MKTLGTIFFSALIVSCAVKNTQPFDLAEQSTIGEQQSKSGSRIQYLYSFNGPDDLGLKAPFTNLVKEFLTGPDEKNMTRPYALAVNSQLIVVTDPGQSAVHLFNIKNKKYKRISAIGEHTLVSPIGVTLGVKRLFIADSVLNSVFILDHKMNLLNVIKGFERVTGLAFELQSKRLYVADTHAHHILVYDQDGETIGTFGERGDKDGQFNYPTHLAVSKNQVYVNDAMNFRVQVFNLDGKHIKTIGEHGSGKGYIAHPKGIAVNSDGHIFVGEAVANRIQIFSLGGKFLMAFGETGNEQAGLISPSGVTIFEDKIYIADTGNQRVQVFQYFRAQ